MDFVNSLNGLNVVNFNCLREMKLKKKKNKIHLLPEHVLTYKKVITTIDGMEINSIIDSQLTETVSKVQNERNSHLEIWN